MRHTIDIFEGTVTVGRGVVTVRRVGTTYLVDPGSEWLGLRSGTVPTVDKAAELAHEIAHGIDTLEAMAVDYRQRVNDLVAELNEVIAAHENRGRLEVAS